MTISPRACLPFLLLLLTACGGGAPVRYYLVEAVDGPVLVDTPPGPAVQVLDLDIPQYLQRFQLATRSEGHRIEYALSHQWSESLRENLMRTLAANLSQRLATADVATPLTRLGSSPQVRVRVHIDRFERNDDGRILLQARWQITDPEGGRVLRTERTELASTRRYGVDDHAGAVGEMAEQFGAFSTLLAEALLAGGT